MPFPSHCPLVAVVDDDMAVGKSVQRLLQSMGYRAHYYDSGASFLHSLRLRVPDCVLVDANMPVTSGIELIKCIKRTEWKLPMILATGNRDERLLQTAQSYGAAGVLLKPYHTDELASLITEALGCQGYVAGRCPWPCPVIGHAVWNCAFSGFSDESRILLNARLRLPKVVTSKAK
jgi:FixJ family two-component response regulator